MEWEKLRKMTPKQKQAVTYLVASVPMLWWGGVQFDVGGHDHAMAIALSVSLTFGGLFAVCGIVMLFKQGEKKVAEDTAIRLAPEQTDMFVDEHILSADMVKSFRTLGETVKECTAERAEIRATLISRGITIDEDGNIEVK